jgi:PRTRC genetic system protein E
MPLLAGRTVLITVAKVDHKAIRVNVIPNPAKADENPALATPLTYTGPPEERDAEFGKHLAGHVQTHNQTASTLAKAKATQAAAAKAAQEEANYGNPNEIHQNVAATGVFNFVQTGPSLNWYLA